MKQYFHLTTAKKTTTLLCIFLVPMVIADTMMENVSKAIQSNPELMQSKMVVLETKAKKKGTIANFHPRFDVSGNIGRENIHYTPDNNPKYKTDENRLSGTMRLTIPAFNGFEDMYRYKENKSLYNAKIYDNIYLAMRISYNTIDAYIQVIKHMRILKLAEDNLLYHKNMMSLIESRIKQGISDHAELTQLEGRYYRALASTKSAENNVNLATAKLEALTGFVNSSFQTSNFSTPTNSKLNLLDIKNKALKEHPRLKAENERIEASLHAVNATDSGYYPKVDIVLDSTWDKNVYGYMGKKRDMRVLAEAQWNIYGGGKTKARKEESYFRYEGNKQQLIQVRRQITLEASNSYSEYQSLKKQHEDIKLYVQNMSKTESLYEEQFKVRKRSLLDLLNSQNELFAAKQSLVVTELDLSSSWHRVQTSMGMLFTYLNINYSPPK